MKFILLVCLVFLNVSAFGSDKGNGGSGSEAEIVGLQTKLELVGIKLRTFFLQNEKSLAPVFPEFEIKTLVEKITTSEISVVNDELVDKHDKRRTCLNFPDSSLVKCNYSEMESLLNEPSALFVLIFHEYLGLIGAEETSPSNPRMVDGYSISRRLAAYVYDINYMTNPTLELHIGTSVETRVIKSKGLSHVASITGNGWNLVPKNTKRIKVQIEPTGAYINFATYELHVRESETTEWALLEKGQFENTDSSQKIAYVDFEHGKEYYISVSGQAAEFSAFFDFTIIPHTERLTLTTEENYVLFDAEISIEKDPYDQQGILYSTVDLNYFVNFK